MTGTEEELFDLAERTAREAGALARRHRESAVGVTATKSSATDVVTAADTAVEDLVRSRIVAARPDDAILGEEGSHRAGRSGLTWVVDPIDGTVNFLYGITRYSVSIAVVTGDPTTDGWEPVAGCVHAPALGTTYRAGLGRGAWVTEDASGVTAPVAVNDSPPLAQALVGTGFGYRARRRSAQARVLTGVLPRVRDIRRMGGAALDLCAVAAGELDAYYERGLGPWDMAAARLVVTEAGGRVTGLRGASPGAAMTLAGPAPLVAELDRLLQALGADDADDADDDGSAGSEDVSDAADEDARHRG